MIIRLNLKNIKSIMNFADSPHFYISEYFREKIHLIDINCEKSILNMKDAKETENLNNRRLELIKEINLIKKKVTERTDLSMSQYSEEMLAKDSKKIQDQIFMDQYCFVFEPDFKLFPFIDLKCGILILSQYSDDLLEDLG